MAHFFFIAIELILLGAPHTFPNIPHLLGGIMFYAGVIGLVLYPIFLAYKYREAIRARLEPSQIIFVGSLFGAAFLLVVAGIAYAMKPSATPSTAQVTERIVKDAAIEWDGGERITFQAIFLRPGEKLSIYVESGGLGGAPTMPAVMPGIFHRDPRRMEIGFIERFVRGSELKVTLATVAKVDGNQQVLQWGEQRYANTKVGITWGSYFGRVILIGQNGQEEPYPFMIISRSEAGKPAVPVILGPTLLGALFD